MHKYTFVLEAKKEVQYLKEREALLVISKTSDEHFLLDCWSLGESMRIDFFKTLIAQHEGPTDALVRLMEEKRILYGEYESLGPLYTKGGDVSCYHVFLTKRSTAMAQGVLALDLENLLLSMEAGLFVSEDSKKALKKLLG